jgi:prepilin-type N-terminal cleavage/methylation domain-containing protein
VRHGRVARGFNLLELMIALALGLLLLAAFLTVVARCRDLFAANESLARLEDAARHAVSALAADIEHAGFYGLSSAAVPRLVRGGEVIAAAERLRQGDAAAPIAPVAGLPAGAHDCGTNFAVDLALPVEGANNVFATGRDARDCAPTATAGGARAGADTLTLRFATSDTSVPRAGRIQVYSRRLEANGFLDLFADGRAPGALSEDAQVRDLEVRTWYVANSSVDRPGWPALRVKSLTESRGAAQFRDEEILPGVEDLQVELVVEDAGPAPHIARVAPGTPQARTGRVIAVRFWLRIRSDTTERAFHDDRRLDYADTFFVPDRTEAGQRRLLVARTVALRNLRP